MMLQCEFLEELFDLPLTVFLSISMVKRLNLNERCVQRNWVSKRSGYFSPYNMYMHLERCLKLPFLHIEAWAGFVFGVVTNDDTVHKKVN